MTQKNDPKPALSPQLFWRVLFAGNVMSLGVLLFVFHRMMDAAAAPRIGIWMLGVGVVSVLPSLLYRRRIARRARQRSPARPLERETDNARQLAQLNQVVVTCALAELPGLFGCLYYLFSREWGGTLLLLAVTAILLLQARPR